MQKKLFLLLLFANSLSKIFAQVILNEGFENGPFPPTGWTVINAGNGSEWSRNDDTSFFGIYLPAYKGSKCMVYPYDDINKANAWMISPALNLTQGQSYGISFYYRALNNRYPEKLKVTIGNDATVASQNTILWNNNGQDSLINTIYQKAITQFIPSSSGNYFVGFNCYSEADQYFLLVDSIVVKIAPPSPPACATNISPANNAINVSRPRTNLQWSVVPDVLGYQLYFGTATPPVEYGPFNIVSNTTDITNLDYNTTYYWYVVPYNDAGYASGCKTNNLTTFTTIPLPPKPPCTNNISPANNATNVSFPSADFSITPLAEATGYSLYINDGIIINIESYNSANFTFDRLRANTEYTWYVVPKNDGGSATGCNTRAFRFTTGGALPVTWIYFNGTNNDGSNKLQWATALETNNKYFVVERSDNGRTFYEIGKVNSTAPGGNSSQVLKYTFTDTRPLGEYSWYRLKQVDKDGNATYSTVVIVRSNSLQNLQIVSTYPNPVKNILYSNIVSTRLQTIQISITDVLGRTMKTIKPQVQKGDNTVSIPIDLLANGTYFVKIAAKDGTEMTQKIIKQ
jgi:hypothetical protein